MQPGNVPGDAVDAVDDLRMISDDAQRVEAIKARIHEVEETKRVEIKEREDTARRKISEHGESDRDTPHQLFLALRALFVCGMIAFVAYAGFAAWNEVQVARIRASNPAAFPPAPASPPPAASSAASPAPPPPAPPGSASSVTLTISAGK